jgi:nucleoside-diphosphate-sugar epimerase
MRVLVTGGSGFLGAALCGQLVEEGHEVVAFDNNSRGHARRLAGLQGAIEFIEGDVRNFEQVRAATKGCEGVWHLAYINGTRFFYERADDVLEVGIKGAINTIEASLSEGVSRYVLASTSETYGEPLRVPTDESEPLKVSDVTNPRFSYGGGKITCELLTLHLAARRGLETVIFRPHNFYGPDMGVEHVVPEITRRIVTLSDGLRRKSIDLPIQGTGSDTRAFCFVSDGARGALVAGVRGDSGGIYHVGTDRETTVADVVKLIGESLGIAVTIIPGDQPAGGTPRRCPDITKLRSLGFEPKVSLEEGIERTTRWYAEDLMGSNIAEVTSGV